MGSTGVVRNTAAMTGAELRSETFRDLLNEKPVRGPRAAFRPAGRHHPLQHQTACDGSLTVDSWILDGEVRQKNAPALELDPQAPGRSSRRTGSYAEAQTVTITADSPTLRSTTRLTAPIL